MVCNDVLVQWLLLPAKIIKLSANMLSTYRERFTCFCTILKQLELHIFWPLHKFNWKVLDLPTVDFKRLTLTRALKNDSEILFFSRVESINTEAADLHNVNFKFFKDTCKSKTATQNLPMTIRSKKDDFDLSCTWFLWHRCSFCHQFLHYSYFYVNIFLTLLIHSKGNWIIIKLLIMYRRQIKLLIKNHSADEVPEQTFAQIVITCGTRNLTALLEVLLCAGFMTNFNIKFIEILCRIWI